MNRVRLFVMIALVGLLAAACNVAVEPVVLQASFKGTGTGSIEVGAPVNQTLTATKTKVSIDNGTKVTLTAKADAGSTFTGWAGACSGTSATCSVTMDGGKTVTATFTKDAPETSAVTFGVTGSGSIDATVDGTTTTYSDGEQLVVDNGTEVTLKAVPAGGTTSFTSWTGACSAEATDTCVVTIAADTTIGVTFTTLGNYNLTVSYVMGLGSGAISDGGNIACDYAAGDAAGTGTCTDSIVEGTTVTLTATPAAGSTLLEWGGDCSGSTTTCDVTLNSDANVTARFVMDSTTPVSVQISGSNDMAEEFLQVSTAPAYPNANDVVIGTGFLELTYSTRWVSDQAVGLRFPNINIPVGASIASAELVFTANAGTGAGTADALPLTVNIYGEASTNAAAFQDTVADGAGASGNVTARIAGATSATWNIAAGAWATDGTEYSSTDVSDIVTGIISMAGWNPSSNAIAFVLRNDLVGTAGVQDGRRLLNNTGATPILRVTYR